MHVNEILPGTVPSVHHKRLYMESFSGSAATDCHRDRFAQQIGNLRRANRRPSSRAVPESGSLSLHSGVSLCLISCSCSSRGCAKSENATDGLCNHQVFIRVNNANGSPAVLRRNYGGSRAIARPSISIPRKPSPWQIRARTSGAFSPMPRKHQRIQSTQGSGICSNPLLCLIAKQRYRLLRRTSSFPARVSPACPNWSLKLRAAQIRGSPCNRIALASSFRCAPGKKPAQDRRRRSGCP